MAVGGFRSFMQMLLWDNFVHADLHPGNIMIGFVRDPLEGWNPLLKRLAIGAGVIGRFLQRIVTPGPLPPDPLQPIITDARDPHAHAQLVYLDCGLVSQLGPRDFQNFTDLFKCLVLEGDGVKAGQMIIERSPQPGVIDADGFCEQLSELLVKPVFKPTTLVTRSRLNTLRLDRILNELFRLCREHRVRLDPAFTNLVMSLLCVEGLGRKLAPEMDLKPLLAEAALQFLVRDISHERSVD